VAQESIHLTLKFLGSIKADAVPDVTRVMAEAVLDTPPFVLRVHGLGAFPNRQRPQVLWAGVAGDLALLIRLQQRLDAGLARLGFTPESRPFTGHLTLARIRDETPPAEREALGGLVSATSFSGSEFTVASISLIRSDLRTEGPLYTRIAAAALASRDAG
jgi:2'-5' RNA ligase